MVRWVAILSTARIHRQVAWSLYRLIAYGAVFGHNLPCESSCIKGQIFFSYSQLLHVGYKHDKVLKSVTYCSLLVAQYVENKLEYMTLQINCPHTFMKSKFIRRTSVASIYFETTIRLSFIFQFLVAMSNTSWHIFKLKPKFSHLTTPDINVNSCHRSTVFGN